MWGRMMGERHDRFYKNDEVEQLKFYRMMVTTIEYPEVAFLFVAEDDKLIGFLNGGLAPYSLGIGNVMLVQGVYVSPDYRSKGVFKQLTDAAENRYEGKYEYVEMVVHPGRVKAYERMGFHQTGARMIREANNA